VIAAIMIDRACSAATPASATSTRGGAAAGAQANRTPALASGACQQLAPTGHARGQTVFIDAGHGGPDPGVIGSTPAGAAVKESAAALAVAKAMAGRLRGDGYRVVLSRSADTSVRAFADGGMSADQVRQDLESRVHCANGSGAAALVSVHFNGFDSSSAQGSQTIYDDVRPFAAQSERLARNLQASLVSKLHLNDRGVVTDDQLDAATLSDRAASYGHLILLGPAEPGWVDRGTTMPGALVEPMFLTNPDEARLASSSSGQRQIADALVSGIENYLSGRSAP
jgi:N-acetylmuramoyl-L-alanine amidase